jgi:hypothetical protein
MIYILTVILLIAKLTGYFNYSWWLVFLPSILAIALATIILLGAALIYKNLAD